MKKGDIKNKKLEGSNKQRLDENESENEDKIKEEEVDRVKHEVKLENQEVNMI